MGKLIDSHELSVWLGVPYGTLNQWAYMGRGPAYIRVGRHRRYDTDVVKAWLNAQTVAPTDAA